MSVTFASRRFAVKISPLFCKLSAKRITTLSPFLPCTFFNFIQPEKFCPMSNTYFPEGVLVIDNGWMACFIFIGEENCESSLPGGAFTSCGFIHLLSSNDVVVQP